MAIYVEDDLATIHFKNKEGVEDSDAYFVIRKELPYDGYMKYMDAAISYQMNIPDDEEIEAAVAAELKGEKPKETKDVNATANKLVLSQVQNILMEYGLVEISGVYNKDKSPILAADWRKLPSYLLGQIVKAVQGTAKTKSPNS